MLPAWITNTSYSINELVGTLMITLNSTNELLGTVQSCLEYSDMCCERCLPASRANHLLQHGKLGGAQDLSCLSSNET